MNGYSIPKATLGRLPQYLKYLKSLPYQVGANISATTIAKELFLGEVQVRKDLAAVSGTGKPKVGYDRATLISDIERHLGHEKIADAVLVGAGKLGRALLDFGGFEEFGVRIVAGFDRDESVLRNDNNSKPILPMEEIESYCKEHKITIGVITVGRTSAQSVCDTLVAAGIKAIWNFAPCPLDVPSEIALQQENLALSLAHLKNRISN